MHRKIDGERNGCIYRIEFDATMLARARTQSIKFAAKFVQPGLTQVMHINGQLKIEVAFCRFWAATHTP